MGFKSITKSSQTSKEEVESARRKRKRMYTQVLFEMEEKRFTGAFMGVDYKKDKSERLIEGFSEPERVLKKKSALKKIKKNQYTFAERWTHNGDNVGKPPNEKN